MHTQKSLRAVRIHDQCGNRIDCGKAVDDIPDLPHELSELGLAEICDFYHKRSIAYRILDGGSDDPHLRHVKTKQLRGTLVGAAEIRLDDLHSGFYKHLHAMYPILHIVLARKSFPFRTLKTAHDELAVA